MKEADLQKKIQRRITDRGGFVRKIHGGPNQPQLVDLVGCYRGRFFAFEVKLPHNRGRTDRQRRILEKVREAGGVGLFITSPQHVDRVFDAIDRNTE